MDYLRKCYVTRVRPFAGSNRTAVVRWFWAPEGAPVLRGAIWRSSAWYVQDLDGQYPPPPAIGEERSAPFRWSPGRAGQDLAIAECTVGDRAWFATGIPPAALVPNPPPTPACCRITPLLALGGLLLGGEARPGRIGRGGLRLGGAAIRTLLGASGGLKLGGVTARFVAQGGLMLGGQVVPEPLVAEGGLMLGGSAELVGYTAEGGLMLGGDAEQLAYTAYGGLRLGGTGNEPMALLYCSLRIAGSFTIPNNALTLLSWDTVEEDPSGMYSAGAPTRITVPSPGVYAVQHQLYWGGTGSAFQIGGELDINGTAKQYLYYGQSTALGPTSAGGAALVHLAASDYLQVRAFQAAGFGLNPGIVGVQRPSLRVAAVGVSDTQILSSNVYTTGGQSINSGVRTAIIFDTVNIDPHGMWSAAHPTRMTAPSAGTYLVQWAVSMGTAVNSGKWQSLIGKNGSAIFDVTGFPLNIPNSGLGSGSYTLPLAAGDYVEVFMFHNLGSALTLASYDGVTAWISLTRLGVTG